MTKERTEDGVLGEPDPLTSVRVGSSGDLQIMVHDLGGTGQPLLIAHAAGFCGGAYLPLAEQLREYFRVWALDLRGHGDSVTPIDSEFSWDGMADDILAAVSGLDLGPAFFFGHSMGGGAGLLSEAMRPGTFPSMFLYEPIVEVVRQDVDPVAMAMGRAARARRSEFGSRADALVRLSSRHPYSALDPAALRAYLRYGTTQLADSEVRLKCSPESEARCYEARKKVTLDQVQMVSSDVTVGLGLREVGGPAECAASIVQAIPGARLVSYETLGHLGPLESPLVIAASVLDHFAPLRERKP
jgi:pimeloyl-ACP methyl ester carboxylesterase